MLHVAVSEARSLFNLFSTSPNDSHFYVAKDGTVEQYVDTDLEAYASMAGNASTISVETQGGVTNPDTEPWTDAQLASLARICRWAHDTEGVPLQVMPDSLPASRGVGFHRLGIDPWRVPGGEVWSSSRGKLCPGQAKINQVPQIVALAQGGQENDLDAVQDMRLQNIELMLGAQNAVKVGVPVEQTIGARVRDIQATVSQPQAASALPDPKVYAQQVLAELVNLLAAVKPQ